MLLCIWEWAGERERGDALGQEEEEGRGRAESGWSRSKLLLLFYPMASPSCFDFWTIMSSISLKFHI